MAEKLSFKYDEESAILYLAHRTPYAEQESEEWGDDVIARLNPQTDEVENLEVLFFSRRLHEQPFLELPIIASFNLMVS